MQGFELIFMAPRSHRHKRQMTLDAIVDLAKTHGIYRYTRRMDSESIGNGGHRHSAHFFELTDEPEELMFIVDGDQADELLAAVQEQNIKIFCVRRGIEFYHFGTD